MLVVLEAPTLGRVIRRVLDERLLAQPNPDAVRVLQLVDDGDGGVNGDDANLEKVQARTFRT